jgi:putative Holliday junction resolvase
MMAIGRIMALDLGEKRIGVALSDPLQMLARPLLVIQHKSKAEDLQAIQKLVADKQVTLIVCGYPLSLDGSEGPQGRRIRRYTERLAELVPVPVKLWDETYSTVEAAGIMQATRKRMTPQERRKWVDAVAAAVILQGYLNSHSSPADPNE